MKRKLNYYVHNREKCLTNHVIQEDDGTCKLLLLFKDTFSVSKWGKLFDSVATSHCKRNGGFIASVRISKCFIYCI